MRFASPEELHRLAEAIDPRYRAFVLLGGYGGLRLGEMLGLRWGRVDMLHRRVEVVETLVDVNNRISFDPPKTRASRRIVTLPRMVCDELARSGGPAEPCRLVSPDAKPIRASLFRSRFWTPAVNAAGLAPLRIHDLRHTAVSIWIAAGANPKQVAARAGHTSVSVVLDRYGHLYRDHDVDLIKTLKGSPDARPLNRRSSRSPGLTLSLTASTPLTARLSTLAHATPTAPNAITTTLRGTFNLLQNYQLTLTRRSL
ncbi:MAG: site-specific integrase [Acidimicrobiales bacterium]